MAYRPKIGLFVKEKCESLKKKSVLRMLEKTCNNGYCMSGTSATWLLIRAVWPFNMMQSGAFWFWPRRLHAKDALAPANSPLFMNKYECHIATFFVLSLFFSTFFFLFFHPVVHTAAAFQITGGNLYIRWCFYSTIYFVRNIFRVIQKIFFLLQKRLQKRATLISFVC